MIKTNKPNSDQDVFSVMEKYCQDKGYIFSNTQLDFMAQSCYLHFESRGWVSIKYWPAVAMKWVLNNLDKQLKQCYKPKPRGRCTPQGKSVRNKILEQEGNDK